MFKPRLILLAALLLGALPASAELYRYVDEKGNTIYTDKQVPGSQPVSVSQGQTYKSTRSTRSYSYPSSSSSSPKQDNSNVIPKITFSQPQSGQAIRANDGNISVAFSVNPGLGSNDKLEVLLDGKKVGSSTSVSLKNIDRGQHTVTARVLRFGKPIASGSTTFTVQRAFRRAN